MRYFLLVAVLALSGCRFMSTKTEQPECKTRVLTAAEIISVARIEGAVLKVEDNLGVKFPPPPKVRIVEDPDCYLSCLGFSWRDFRLMGRAAPDDTGYSGYYQEDGNRIFVNRQCSESSVAGWKNCFARIYSRERLRGLPRFSYHVTDDDDPGLMSWQVELLRLAGVGTE